MKQSLFVITLIASLLLVSCGENKKPANKSVIPIETAADQIVKATVTNPDGVRLDMEYNNAKRTARFILKGETIDLKQDTTASGIKYSNSHYEYREWHGEITLKKDGQEVFVHGFKNR